MPAITYTLSAICSTHKNNTKLVTSISFRPTSCSMCTRLTFTSDGTFCFSFCRPSRGPTSTSLTWLGSFMVSVSSLAVDHTGDGLSAREGADLPGELHDALDAQGARGRERCHCDLRMLSVR